MYSPRMPDETDYHGSAHHPAAPFLRQVSPLARCVLLALWTYGRTTGGACIVWPTPRTLADLLGSNASRIRKALAGLEAAGALARCAGAASCVATRQTFPRNRKFILLIPSSQFAKSDLYRSNLPPLKPLKEPVSIKKRSKAAPELLRTNVFVNSSLIKPLIQETPKNDDEFLINKILKEIDHGDTAIPWRETITAAERATLADLAREHGPIPLARGLVAVRRCMVRAGNLRLTGPRMLGAWGSVWHHHGATLRAAMVEPRTEPEPVRAELEPLHAMTVADLDAAMVESGVSWA